MSLLQEILEMVDEDNAQNVDIVDSQNPEKSRFVVNADMGNREINPKGKKSTSETLLNINSLENPAKNVVNVACTREVENHLPSSSSLKHNQSNISHARASNNVSKLQIADCDSCPASGYWDYKGPGMYCFHYAIFLGKPGQPVHCDSAKPNCPLIR